MLRSILHCDMNNFYASVECMLDPALKKYPIAVCGSVEERHGIVLAKNYKAKAFDVKTGDAVWQAMNDGIVEFIWVDGKRRIKRESFDKWYASQSKYTKVKEIEEVEGYVD